MHWSRLPGLLIFVSVLPIVTACNLTPPLPRTAPGNVPTDQYADQVYVLPLEEITRQDVVLVTVEVYQSENDITCPTPAVPGVTFPQQPPIAGDREVMEAELIGTLVLVDGCLRVNPIFGDGRFLPVWPSEFTLELKNNAFQILDETSQVIGRVGEEIYMGGGTGSVTDLTECADQRLSAACPGPYWIVGDEVRLNLLPDSGLFRLEIVSEPEGSFFLLHKKPVLDEWIESNSSIKGKLVHYEPSRCLRVQSDSGLSDYLLLWPADYSAQIEHDVIEILNGSGQVVARVGETVQLGGGKISVNWSSENYRAILDCRRMKYRVHFRAI